MSEQAIGVVGAGTMGQGIAQVLGALDRLHRAGHGGHGTQGEGAIDDRGQR